MAHTPNPLRIKPHHFGFMIRDEKDNVAWVQGKSKVSAANARLIVKAVNSFEAMRDALIDAAELMQSHSDACNCEGQFGDCGKCRDRILAKSIINAALALADKEQP